MASKLNSYPQRACTLVVMTDRERELLREFCGEVAGHYHGDWDAMPMCVDLDRLRDTLKWIVLPARVCISKDQGYTLATLLPRWTSGIHDARGTDQAEPWHAAFLESIRGIVARSDLPEMYADDHPEPWFDLPVV